MSVRCLKNMEMPIVVMPAWIAGIHRSQDASETSTSTWIPALHAGVTQWRVLLKVTEAPPASIPKENSKHAKFRPRQSL